MEGRGNPPPEGGGRAAAAQVLREWGIFTIRGDFQRKKPPPADGATEGPR